MTSTDYETVTDPNFIRNGDLVKYEEKEYFFHGYGGIAILYENEKDMKEEKNEKLVPLFKLSHRKKPLISPENSNIPESYFISNQKKSEQELLEMREKRKNILPPIEFMLNFTNFESLENKLIRVKDEEIEKLKKEIERKDSIIIEKEIEIAKLKKENRGIIECPQLVQQPQSLPMHVEKQLNHIGTRDSILQENINEKIEIVSEETNEKSEIEKIFSSICYECKMKKMKSEFSKNQWNQRKKKDIKCKPCSSIDDDENNNENKKS